MINLSTMTEYLWGRKSRFTYLLAASTLLLFAFLGARDIWTQEHRWADIVAGMFFRDDFLHPYLGENTYYDKPLLSYWLIAVFSKVMGGLSTWALRLPSALSGLLAIWSIYRLGSLLKNKSFGLLSGWLLLTTFYFVFWARTSSADMLNLGGTLFAIAWYFTKRDSAQFKDYAVFFLIVAVTSLCKGLIGAVVPAIAVVVDIAMRKAWKAYFRWPVFLAMVPALFVYMLPFIASSLFGGESYHQNGLYLVYRENILRYFQPFDHQGPIYTYFLYLPIYTFPWALFLIPALLSLPARWKALSEPSRWISLTLLALFLFFTLSGSRRSYYVLPMVPFAILLIADWMMSGAVVPFSRRAWSAGLTLASFVLVFLAIDAVPAWYYSQVGVSRFAFVLKQEAEKIRPWGDWQVTLLDAESKLNYYLELPPTLKNQQIKGAARNEQTTATLISAWPILLDKPADHIFITRLRYVPLLKNYFNGYRVVRLQSRYISRAGLDAPVAFIPGDNISVAG